MIEKLITYTLIISVSGGVAALITEPLIYWLEDPVISKASPAVFSFLWFVGALVLCFVEAKSRAK